MKAYPLLITALLLALSFAAAAGGPTVEDLLEDVAIEPEGDLRGQRDIVGFASTARQMEAVAARCEELAAPRREALSDVGGLTDEVAFAAAVCPHDDYYYAGRLYSLIAPHVTAGTVVLLGVFHKALVFDCGDVLVFDSYRSWRGPYGPVAVSNVRKEIVSRLPRGSYIVDNDMHMVEHSVEAIVPWLQHYNRDVEIVSILVPYMDWSTLDRLAGELSAALESIIAGRGWKLGEDIALVVSADAIHYGDAGWGGASYADFGTGIEGYEEAVARDVRLAEDLLCGPLGGDEDRVKLKEFMHTCVDPEDVTEYRVTWCGRFSIPLGLNVASRLSTALRSRPLRGALLDYGTSVSEASIDLEGLEPMGATAPNNLRHFVGYAAIGYE